ncbi:hypothetical protein PGB90_006281 [Kerria lacca]
MGLIQYIILLAIACYTADGARISSPKQNTIAVGKDSSGKNYTPYLSEWINMSVKSESIVTVPVGGVLELECEAVGGPPPSIKWYHRNNLLQEAGFSEQNEIINTAIGKVKSRLIIDCVMPHHQGFYTCAGTSGSKKKISSDINVFVQENDYMPNLSCKPNIPKIPRIITWGPTLLEITNKDVNLPCAAVGNPPPEIYWINNKNQIIDSDNFSSNYKVLPNGDLLISRISWEDMGSYTCIAQNSLGQDKVESFVYPVRKEE